MAHVGEYTLLITDRNLVPVGDPIVVWTILDLTLRFNEPGSGMFVVPGYSWIRDQLSPGNRVVAMRNVASEDPDGDATGHVVLAGPIEKWLYERSDDGEHAGDGTLTVYFADDLALVAARLAYPDPANLPDAQTASNWTFTGNAEVGMRTLVNLNAGPGALAARQVPQLELGTLASVGSTVTVTAERMEPLGQVLRRIAERGGNLGFRTVQSGTDILFEVYEPTDKSAEIRFGVGLGSLRYVGYEVVAPTATAVVVGGQGSGAAEYMIERVDTAGTAAWGRLERHIARPGDGDLTEMQTEGDEELAEAAETARLPISVVDTHDAHFGLHYGLGDKVSVESWPGEQITDVVRTVHLQAWPTAGEVVSVTVGSQAASSDPAWISRLRSIDRRVGHLERTVSPA